MSLSKKQILLINDVCGYGKVATAAMLPILSYMGMPVHNLPTAIVSNTLDYGKFNLLDTTDYIKGVFPVWKELGFHFDAIATGFIASEQQADLIARYCREQEATGTAVFVDPIMGDEGKLYNGVTPATINSMREMLSVAHLCYPNYTEACYLTDKPYRPEGVSAEEARQLVEELRQIAEKAEKPFILKGIMTVAGAKKALEAGASGIVVSNHGGRVLDQCPATAEVLPAIADAVGGQMTILVDGGIRTGMDVFKALALGADAVLIGRPFVNMVYGGGAEGVQVYVDKLKAELADTMAMCGAHCLADIKRSMIFGY